MKNMKIVLQKCTKMEFYRNYDITKRRLVVITFIEHLTQKYLMRFEIDEGGSTAATATMLATFMFVIYDQQFNKISFAGI